MPHENQLPSDSRPYARHNLLVGSLIVLLIISGYLSIKQFSDHDNSVLSNNLFSQELIEECVALYLDKVPTRNELAPDILAPRLLDDVAEIEKYLAEFPIDEYTISSVHGIGEFYLDNIEDFIKDRLRKGKIWEPSTVQLMGNYVRFGSTVIDAGAHIGSHTIVMANLVGPNGRVYAFEPQKKIYRELYHNLKLNNLNNAIPLRYALGDEAGVIEMNVASIGNEGGTSIGVGGDKAELRTIDGFNFNNVSFIKIDVEQFEDPVLVGARNTIAIHKPILLVEIQGGFDFDTAPEDIRDKVRHTVDKIKAMGYSVVRVGVYDYLGIPNTL